MDKKIISGIGAAIAVIIAILVIASNIGVDTTESNVTETTIAEEEKEEKLCPTCKNTLVFVEGCSICIECGYSGCTSG